MSWLLGDCCGPGGSLVWTSPAWWVAVAGVVAAVLVGATLRPWPDNKARWGEVALWIVTLATVVFAVAGPVWVQEGERTEEGRLVVLVDASRSMDVRGGNGEPRSTAVSALLDRLPGAEVYSFGEGLRTGAPATYDDSDSDLGGALDALARRYAGERLAGVVVVSDGADRGGLRRRLLSDDQAPLPPIGGPLTLYQVGTPGSRDDVAIVDMRAGGFAFLRAPFKIQADVRATGQHGASVPVQLSRDGQPAGSTTVTLDAEGRGTATFTVNPDKVGRFLFEASVPVGPTDTVPSNNALDLAVRVVRDRVRVLQVCGSPSWDQKFLRLFLKEDPSVDLVSFFILRTARDMGSGYAPSELSLIGFPYEELFSTQLSTFDLVIFQNFDYEPYFDRQAPALLQNLADYVEQGGALVMLGGDRSFDLGKYAGTSMASVLPVQLGVTADGVDTNGFQPRLTEAGERHPITRLTADLAENVASWSKLSPLDGVNRTMGARTGAAVLLEHPSLAGAGGEPLPVLAVGEYGDGRSMALAVDSSWRWSFDEAGAGGGNQAYLRFWKNAMRWLIGDPEDQPVTVEVSRDNYEPGQEAVITVRARDIAFAPIASATVEAVVSGPGEKVSLRGVTTADGAVTLTLPAGDRGAHRVKVIARGADGGLLGEAQSVYAVTTRDPELDDVEPDPAFLQALAARTGGAYVAPGAWVAPMIDPEAGRKVRDRKETPLWSAPILVIIAVLASAGSWTLRRRAGLR